MSRRFNDYRIFTNPLTDSLDDLNANVDDELCELICEIRLDQQPRMLSTCYYLMWAMERWRGGLPRDLATIVGKWWALMVGLKLDRMTGRPLASFGFATRYLNDARYVYVPSSATFRVRTLPPPWHMLPSFMHPTGHHHWQHFSLDCCESGNLGGLHHWRRCARCDGFRCGLCQLPSPCELWGCHSHLPHPACFCPIARRRSLRLIERVRDRRRRSRRILPWAT